MKKFTILALLILTTACTAHTNKPFEWTNIMRLTPGVSTEVDAIRLLGDPYKREDDGPGGERLTWDYVEAGIGGRHEEAVQIAFDKGGRMVRVVKQLKTD